VKLRDAVTKKKYREMEELLFTKLNIKYEMRGNE
jgi:hypothetical protein